MTRTHGVAVTVTCEEHAEACTCAQGCAGTMAGGWPVSRSGAQYPLHVARGLTAEWRKLRSM
jgi:hypothetical protein